MTDITGITRSATRAAGIIAIALAFIVPAGPAMAVPAPGAPLIFAGSGANLPVVRVLSRAFRRSHPGITIDVPASISSTSGILAAADGAIAIGLISRPMKDNEKGLGLEVRNFARTPMIIGVHPAVAEGNITFEELLDIYRGKKGKWKDGREIVVLTREPGDSSIDVLLRGVPGFKRVYEESLQAKRWTILYKDLAMNETLAKTPSAVGFSDLGAVTIEKHAIKPLKISGVAPTLNNLAAGKYPFFKTLTFVYRKDKLPAEARAFIDFVRSREGEKILKANGYLPEK